MERTILASLRYRLARSVRAEVEEGCGTEVEEGDQTLKHSRAPRGRPDGDGSAPASAAQACTSGFRGTGSVSFLPTRSFDSVEGWVVMELSSFSDATMLSREQVTESCVTEDSLWSRLAWERARERVLCSGLVQLVQSVVYGDKSEPWTSREHKSSEEQLWSGTSADSDTMSDGLSTDAGRKIQIKAGFSI